MRILGIDPGLATVGIGIVDAAPHTDLAVLEWLTITTTPGKLHARLAEIDRDLTTILDESRPDIAVVERLFFARNAVSGIEVAHARGVILCRLALRHIPILEPSPLQLKSAITGDGKADKQQMQTMLLRLLKLKEIPRPDDAADALALAVFGSLQQNMLQQHAAGRNACSSK